MKLRFDIVDRSSALRRGLTQIQNFRLDRADGSPGGPAARATRFVRKPLIASEPQRQGPGLTEGQILPSGDGRAVSHTGEGNALPPVLLRGQKGFCQVLMEALHGAGENTPASIKPNLSSGSAGVTCDTCHSPLRIR